ncbi:MAG: hypothetical protein NVSMB17_13830 [Candidatus Dormibacteria bacterium]
MSPDPTAAPATSPALKCHLPEEQRAWGWAAQLYALRSRRSWGRGDLDDLARLARWSKGLGAGFIQLNPLHAAAPTGPQQPSPYFPSSRRFRNASYIAVEKVPGFAAAAVQVAPLAGEARALNTADLVDHDRVHALKLRALEAVWATDPPTPGFDRWSAAAGQPLATYTAYCVHAEVHGADWRTWPGTLRNPVGAPPPNPGRARFHAWLQWLLDRQLERAARELPPICDLAIGADPGGADAWTWADQLLPGFSVGAPPDEMNLRGQDWGFPAFNPRVLVETGFSAFREIVRANMRHAGGLRIDHVMGLFRLWLIPRGGGPADGAYVTYPSAPMLDILAEESRAARALVVGEDLGTVEPGVRAELRRRRVLSYRLLCFEDRPPRTYPRLSLGAVTTHDLPTVAGLWTGADETAMRDAGLEPNHAANEAMANRLARLGKLGPAASAGEAVLGAYRALSASPSILRAATLEDAVAAIPRPNMPGTTTEWSNWCIPLPGGLEGLQRSPRARALAAAMQDR